MKRRRTMPKKPLKIVSCMVFDERGRLLLLKRHHEDLAGQMWAAPGGSQEPNEAPITTILREVKEETGLDLNDIEYLGTHEIYMPHGAARKKTYVSRVSSFQRITINPLEHEEYKWFSLDELIKHENIIWGLPTELMDFGLIEPFGNDPTLSDGSNAVLIESVR
jgi:8-oxo-dGTP diphosphatase